MPDRNEPAGRMRELVDRRIALETRLQNENAVPSENAVREYESAYNDLQRQHAALFREASDDSQRITIMLELMRILENRLVYLQNFIVDTTSDSRVLSQLVIRFIEQLTSEKSTVLTPLEATYYRAVASLYAGDAESARAGFSAACASEESDEANDIKYKSYVILGHLSHEDRDYSKAKELHDQSMRYSANGNVTAQALALKALNSYALQDHDEALRLFEESLKLFDPDQPFFNSYFYRNALLFCGGISFDRGLHDRAEEYYGRVLSVVEETSYDHFDAMSHLGRIRYLQGHYRDAAQTLEKAIGIHKLSENEYIVDTWFWIARAHLKLHETDEARKYLERIAASEVRYEKKAQAAELLLKVS